MLLFILLHHQKIIVKINSNTSHVIIYRKIKTCVTQFARIQIHLMLLFIRQSFPHLSLQKQIQIHLMLLFIGIGQPMLLCLYSFKYISCYYLSSKGATQEMVDIIQIHLMLLFILTLLISLSKTSIIQIHLMLLFIKFRRKNYYGVLSIQIHLMLLFISFTVIRS